MATWQLVGPARLAWHPSSMCFAGDPRVPAHAPAGTLQEPSPSHPLAAIPAFRPAAPVARGLLAAFVSP